MKLTRQDVERDRAILAAAPPWELEHEPGVLKINRDLAYSLIGDWLEMDAALQEKPSSESHGMATAHAMLTELVKKFEANDPPMYLPKEWTAQQIKLVLSAIGTQPQKPELGRIVEYDVFSTFDPSQSSIDTRLRQGWELYGVPFYSGSVQWGVVQAMVRREPAK